jgi:ABC-type lipoprotein release transport system permease subunit
MNLTTIKIAWRNIWRNKLRSSVVIIAMALGLFGGLAGTGIMKGMVEDQLNNTLENQVSDIQIHDPKFIENQEVNFHLNDVDQLLNSINNEPEVIATCQRTKTFGMASTASKGMGVTINGIIPEEEMKVTKIYTKLTDTLGSYFESDKKNRILISQRLAEKLNAKIKSKIIITFQDYTGNLTGASFKVEGIFKSHNSMFDEQNVFVKKVDLDRLLNLPENSAHEIAILLENHNQSELVADRLQELFPDKLVRSWLDIDPLLKMTASYTEYMLFIFMIIILLALGFAIVNTMLMVILERTKELGMIMAIGMNKGKVFRMIMYETTLLALVGGLFGLLISIIFTSYYGQVGIDISSVGEGFEAMGYSSVLYPSLDVSDYINVIIMVIITGVIASIFPTVRALKMKPADAVRD